jgi:hypothetical protein
MLSLIFTGRGVFSTSYPKKEMEAKIKTKSNFSVFIIITN